MGTLRLPRFVPGHFTSLGRSGRSLKAFRQAPKFLGDKRIGADGRTLAAIGALAEEKLSRRHCASSFCLWRRK